MVALGPRRELNEVEEAPRMTARVDVDRIDGKPRTVRELFTDRKYGVDYYQREYAWTQANAPSSSTTCPDGSPSGRNDQWLLEVAQTARSPQLQPLPRQMATARSM